MHECKGCDSETVSLKNQYTRVSEMLTESRKGFKHSQSDVQTQCCEINTSICTYFFNFIYQHIHFVFCIFSILYSLICVRYWINFCGRKWKKRKQERVQNSCEELKRVPLNHAYINCGFPSIRSLWEPIVCVCSNLWDFIYETAHSLYSVMTNEMQKIQTK